ncbi:hypothetical protein CEXT_381781 [Caerostris extrusa]|uniref:Uncharacterized protein n=1 Tax=Caerostris extrusa TaxID=172846 RepID=A0AAV4WGC6_CAEEX|nr:hypothetical protein CEXT_381781 [Caerostris extrusa]
MSASANWLARGRKRFIKVLLLVKNFLSPPNPTLIKAFGAKTNSSPGLDSPLMKTRRHFCGDKWAVTAINTRRNTPIDIESSSFRFSIYFNKNLEQLFILLLWLSTCSTPISKTHCPYNRLMAN